MVTVRFSQSARAELIDAQGWYEHEVSGLGRRFREAIDVSVGRISASPRQFRVVFKNGLFYGAEADVNYMSNSGGERLCASGNCSGNPTGYEDESKWTGYGTLRGRIGMAFDPALVFLTGGLAAADVKDQFISSVPGNGYSKSGLNFGWTLGAGTEFAEADRVSISLQYLYLQMLERNADLVCASCIPVKNGALLDDSASIFRVGVNYHFNRPGWSASQIGPFVRHIETDAKETPAILDGASHLPALREIACFISHDDVRIEGMATSLTVSILVV